MEEQYNEREEWEGPQHPLLSSPLSMTKTQMLVTSIPVVATGVVEIASHFNFGLLLAGGFVTLVMARHTQDILNYLVPGQDVEQVHEVTERVVDALSPMRGENNDQAFFPKLKRLVGIDPPRVVDALPKNATPQERSGKQAREESSSSFREDELLRLGYLVQSGNDARFDPHMDLLLGRGLIVAGVQGMGKSNIAALVMESASRCDMPVVMFDLKREYHTIGDVAPNAIRAGHESLEGSIRGYFVLSEATTDEFAHLVMSGKHQAIIDLPSYGDDLNVCAKVMAALLKSLMAWSKAQGEDDRLPCLVMLDEAQVFLPQDQTLSPLNRDTLITVQAAFWQMCNMGRSMGYTMCFFTQSIANLQKWAIKNCQCKVVGIHVEKNDLDRCVEEVDPELVTREQIKTMPKGVGVVIGFTPSQILVKFDKRLSRHVSNTPNVARLRKPLLEQRVVRPSVQSSVKPADTVQQSSRLPDLPEKKALTLEEKYAKEIAVWESLKDRGEAKLRPFAEAMELKETKAYDLLTELADEGLIEWERRKGKV